jgi:NADPH-dependent curcumin reductase CurA
VPKLKNRKIVLASRPTGEATADNFQVIETEEPDRLDSGVLLKTLWLSLDP